MKRTTVIRTAAMAVLAGVTTALPATSFGEVIFQDNFEGGYQGSLIYRTPQVGSWTGGSGYTTDQTGGSGFPNPAANGGSHYADPWMESDAAPSRQSTNETLQYDFDLYVVGNANANPVSGFNIISFNNSPGVSGRAFDVIFQQTGTIEQYHSGSNYTQIPAGTFSFDTDKWVHATIVANYVTQQTTVTVGADTTSFPFSVDAGNNGTNQTVFIDEGRRQAVSGGTTTGFFDNYTLQTYPVPEPASLGLMAVVGACALGVRRRKTT